MYSRRQGDVASGRTLRIRLERRLRKRTGETAGNVVGNWRPDRSVETSATAGRHPKTIGFAETAGRIRGNAAKGYNVEKLLIKPEEGVWLPGCCSCRRSRRPTVSSYTFTSRARRPTRADGPIERLVRAGETVLAVDLRGTGQTQASLSDNNYSVEFQDVCVAYLLGRSYVGMRAEDVLVCARYAAERAAGGREGKVQLIAIGNVGVSSLHAAAMEPRLFRSVALSRSLISWSDVIHNRLNKELATHVVHGALRHYDLPDLAATLGDALSVELPANAVGAVIHQSK